MSKAQVLVSIALGPTCFVLGALITADSDGAPRQAPPPVVAPAESARTTQAPTPELETKAPIAGPTATAPSTLEFESASTQGPSPAPSRSGPTPSPLRDPISVVADPKRAQLYVELAERCEELGFEVDAGRFREAALEAGSASPRVLEGLFEDDPAAYVLALKQALDLNPSDASLVEALAEFDPVDALRRARDLLANAPTNGAALRVLLELDPHAGRDAVVQAYAADPEDGALRELLARHAPTDAWPLLIESLGAEPADYGLLYDATVAATALGNPAQAALLLEGGLRATEDPQARLDLITLLARVDPAGAIGYYERARYPFVDPYDGHALVSAYAREGRMGDAVELAGRLVNMEYANDGMSFLTLSLLNGDGETGELGLELALRLADQNPSDVDTRERILSVLSERERSLQRQALAQSWIEGATRADEVDWLGSYFADEHPELASQALRQAYALDPNNAAPLVDLARIAPLPALEALREPLAQAPLDGTLRRALKLSLSSLSESAPAQVVGWLDRFPADPMHQNFEVLDSLAEDCLMSDEPGGTAAARELLGRAQRLAPDDDRAQRIASLRE